MVVDDGLLLGQLKKKEDGTMRLRPVNILTIMY